MTSALQSLSDIFWNNVSLSIKTNLFLSLAGSQPSGPQPSAPSLSTLRWYSGSSLSLASSHYCSHYSLVTAQEAENTCDKHKCCLGAMSTSSIRRLCISSTGLCLSFFSAIGEIVMMPTPRHTPT